MKRHSPKQLYNKVITKLLKYNFIDKNNKKYQFEYWNYNKGVYIFVFTEIENPEKATAIQLYYQYLSDYNETFELLINTFETIEEMIMQDN